ncbi:uncharacterized protein TNCV_15161 [Trichonephila clavipes]|nr:uncharacterized protein TNCV_15161 [Trichonephila clavipes]
MESLIPSPVACEVVGRWCRQFSEGRQSAHDEERSGRPSLMNVDRLELVRQRVMDNRHFMITAFSSQYPQISRSLLCCAPPRLYSSTYGSTHSSCFDGIWLGVGRSAPYISDLAPSDFRVFLHLKKFLSSGERFGNDE